MNIEQIMALADEYSTYPGHPVMRKDLQAAIESLVQERDALSELADKWNLECDEMREDNKRLAAENKTLRDLLAEAANDVDYYSAYAGEYLCKKHDIAGTVATYRAALQGANHEPN